MLSSRFSRLRQSALRSLAIVVGLVMVFAALSLNADSAEAANPPPNFADIRVANEIFSPISMEFTPDGRLFVMTDSGLAHVIENDRLLTTPLFDFRGRVDDFGDRGLFNVALDNNFSQNGFIYIVYVFDTNGTDDGVGRTRLSRLTVNGNTASNEVVLFEDFPDADVDLHYGGAVEHGPDGRLYVSIGDHLLGRNGQDRTNLAGSVIRLNTDGTIPGDNPFFNELSGVNRAIYSFGLRNPWQMEQNPRTGQIFISDVGADRYEELNVLQRGGNFGWFEAEGPKDPGDPASFIDPLWAYPHSDREPNNSLAGCAIVGGAFYETPNPTFPSEFQGQYFTGDFCEGYIVSVNPNNGVTTRFLDGFDFGLLDLEVSPVNGDLYYIDQTFNGDNTFPRGGVGKISFVGEQTDINISSQPSDVSIARGGNATFFVAATGPGDLTYQWRRNGAFIPGETASMLRVNNVDPGDEALYSVNVTSNGQTVRSADAQLRLTNNTAPVPRITVTGIDGGYEAGETFSFSGAATDAEDGTIDRTTLRWDVRLNHDDHDHALIEGFIGRNSSYALPPAIETSTNVWITLYLTATDSEGTSTTVTQRIDPKVVDITVRSDPNGLVFALEGTERTTQSTFSSVVGVTRELTINNQQSLGGTTFTFDRWSDGRSRNQVFTTPNSNRTITAFFNGGGGGGGTGDCTVVASDGGILLTWTDEPGTEVVRNRNGWVTTPAAGTTTYRGEGSVNDGWTIRRDGRDEVCSTDGGGDGGDGDGAGGTGDFSCTAVFGGGTADLTFTGDLGTSVQILRNDQWVRTATGRSTTVSANSGDTVTARLRGPNYADPFQDFNCSTDGGGGGGGGGTCTVTPLGGGILLSWSDEPGTEVIRNRNGFVATPAAGTTTFTGAGSTNDGWIIRRDGVDEICSNGDVITTPTNVCSVTAFGGGVLVTWQDRPGTEVVRNNGGWVTTPAAGATTYVDANGTIDQGWIIRRDGADETCTIIR